MFKKILKFAGKFLLGTLVAVNLFGVAEAKELPEVTWDREVYTMKISDNDPNAAKKRGYQLLDAGTRSANEANKDRIANAIAAKLKEQEPKLNFKLKTSMDAHSIADEMGMPNMEIPLALVPMVVMDFSIDKEYVVNGKPCHRYIMVSAVDIAFCGEDSEGAFTILSNIPLHFYASIPLSNSLDEMTAKDQSELARIFTDLTVAMIRKNLDFVKARKVIDRAFKKRDQVDAEPTYRVENVSYTSDKARGILGINHLMQRIAGNIFTSEFAANTGNVVYPMILADDNYSWVTDASKGLYVTRMNTSHAGEKKIAMPIDVDYKIFLDVTGVGVSEIKSKYESNINGFREYGLRMSSKVGSKSMVVMNYSTEEYMKNDNLASKIIKKEDEIYGGLMIGAAIKSAAAQAGKKVK